MDIITDALERQKITSKDVVGVYKDSLKQRAHLLSSIERDQATVDLLQGLINSRQGEIIEFDDDTPMTLIDKELLTRLEDQQLQLLGDMAAKEILETGEEQTLTFDFNQRSLQDQITQYTAELEQVQSYLEPINQIVKSVSLEHLLLDMASAHSRDLDIRMRFIEAIMQPLQNTWQDCSTLEGKQQVVENSREILAALTEIIPYSIQIKKDPGTKKNKIKENLEKELRAAWTEFLGVHSYFEQLTNVGKQVKIRFATQEEDKKGIDFLATVTDPDTNEQREILGQVKSSYDFKLPPLYVQLDAQKMLDFVSATNINLHEGDLVGVIEDSMIIAGPGRGKPVFQYFQNHPGLKNLPRVARDAFARPLRSGILKEANELARQEGHELNYAVVVVNNPPKL